MIECDDCGKELKNPQGLSGHKQFAHAYLGTQKGRISNVSDFEDHFFELFDDIKLLLNEREREYFRALNERLIPAINSLQQQVNDLQYRLVDSQKEIQALFKCLREDAVDAEQPGSELPDILVRLP